MLGVDVVAEKGDLALRPRGDAGWRHAADQLAEMGAGVEGELRPVGCELGVALVREGERKTDDIAVEGDRAPRSETKRIA